MLGLVHKSDNSDLDPMTIFILSSMPRGGWEKWEARRVTGVEAAMRIPIATYNSVETWWNNIQDTLSGKHGTWLSCIFHVLVYIIFLASRVLSRVITLSSRGGATQKLSNKYPMVMVGQSICLPLVWELGGAHLTNSQVIREDGRRRLNI